jgi:uncharacterized membrane protein YgcG
MNKILRKIRKIFYLNQIRLGPRFGRLRTIIIIVAENGTTTTINADGTTTVSSNSGNSSDSGNSGGSSTGGNASGPSDEE